MTPHGVAAFVVLIITNGATAVTAVIALADRRHVLTKEHANRLNMLERWRDEIGRWWRRLGKHLRTVAEKGMDCPHCGGLIPDVIDVSKLDMSLFPPPPEPIINGNGK